MTTDYYTKRDSLHGFNRAQLRRQLQQKLGITPNQIMFDSRGMIAPDGDKREEVRRQNLEFHLRTSDRMDNGTIGGQKLTKKQQLQLREHLRARLADPGRLERVKVNRKKLAQESKPLPPARTKPESSFIRLSQSVIRQRHLQREIAGNTSNSTDKRRDYGHFIMEIVK